jgi:hypothetical protein
MKVTMMMKGMIMTCLQRMQWLLSVSLVVVVVVVVVHPYGVF